LAYAFPTYEGSGEKTDLPQAEQQQIREAAEAAALGGIRVDRRRDGRSQVLMLHACPLPGPVPRLAAWTMTRVPTIGGQAYVQAMAGLAALVTVVLASAAWLGVLLSGWSRRLRKIEAAPVSGPDDLPQLTPPGPRDLD